ncbi:MAG: TIGR01777 family protein [Candidatus Latescibacterota bacterium]|nr:MAG: TIGR01777 family protein [Candidatus Latescibacterota bacterium]
MRIAVTGAGGLIGKALVRSLETDGHRVVRLVRRPADAARGEAYWDPDAGAVDRASLAGVAAAVHLAGAPIAAGLGTSGRRRAIRESRAAGTRLLAEALASQGEKPRVFVSASAIGFYGDRGDELLTEESGPGAGFLADVCRAWERAADPAREAGIRVVHPRTGVVLSPAGGALAKLLPLFRLGLGGRVGSGRQYMSCISLSDHVRILRRLIEDGRLSGPVNAVLPEPVTNAEFARTLGRVLGRPALLPVPAAVVSLFFGEMGRETLLASQRAVPAKLLAAGFRFEHGDLECALRAELNR